MFYSICMCVKINVIGMNLFEFSMNIDSHLLSSMHSI